MAHFYSQKRVVSLLMMLMTVMTFSTAAPRSVEEARQEAQNLMKKHAPNRVNGNAGVTSVAPKLVYSKAKKNVLADEVCYYVFSSGSNLGYTIVSGDDRLPAIIGYTESGDYDNDRLPDNLKSFMQAYQDFAENVTEEQIAEIKAWKANKNNARTAVEPFMQEQWNQTAPYNNLCPEYNYYSTGNVVKSAKAVTGCVATAVAQILHHYSCPNQLKADIPEYTTQVKVNEYLNTLTMPAIPAGESYDWANMLNQYTGGESTAQNNAVAKLMLHIGCAVKMNYGPSSESYATPETFTKYFGMDKELVRYYDRESYQIAQWDAILYEELANKRPVYYSGQSTGGGHAFVIHGYENGMYYVNWGWGGYCDGYFDITILNPNSNSGAGASSSDDGYGMTNSMIVGIQPDNGVVDNVNCPSLASISKLTLSNATVSSNTLSGNVTCSPKEINLHDKIFVSIGYADESGKYVNISNTTPNQLEPKGFGVYYKDVTIPISFNFEEGKTYNLCLIESTDQKNWTACAGESTTSVKVKIAGGEISIIEENTKLHAKATLNSKSGGYAGMSNMIDITVTNSGDKEYYDKVYVMVSTSETMPTGYTFAQGITAPAGGSTTFSFKYTPATAGKYNFWILDVSGQQIGKSSITFNTTTPPALSFTSIKCANTSDDKTFAEFSGYNTEMNIVHDTKAEFIFEIKNDGGYYEGDFIVYKYDKQSGQWSGQTQTLKIPANTTTKFTFTATGESGDVVGIMLQSANNNVSITGLNVPNKHQTSNGGSYNLSDSEICYLAGPGTGINSMETQPQSLIITGGNGCIYLKANTDRNASIVNISGTTIENVSLNAGEQTIINVPSGIYIVNKTKVIVK